MNVSVGFVCLVAVAILGGMTGEAEPQVKFPGLQIDERIRPLDTAISKPVIQRTFEEPVIQHTFEEDQSEDLLTEFELDDMLEGIVSQQKIEENVFQQPIEEVAIAILGGVTDLSDPQSGSGIEFPSVGFGSSSDGVGGSGSWRQWVDSNFAGSFGGDSSKQCTDNVSMTVYIGTDAGLDAGAISNLKIAFENKNGIVKDYYCVHISAEDPREDDAFYVPIHRSTENQINVDRTCSIPKHGPPPGILEEFQFTYILTAAMVKKLPPDEHFSLYYAGDLIVQLAKSSFEQLPRFAKWVWSDDINEIYYGYFPMPEVRQFWAEDAWFGAQRLQGVVPNIIELCSKIPDKLRVTEDTVHGLLEGSTLQQALERKKIFMTDLHLLDGIQYKNNRNINHAVPIALFYLNQKDELMPIAIQLWQKKGPNNPIYTPYDNPFTWIIAKMYYNNAEAQLHEIVHHFCHTHLIMDGIATSMNRQLATSHPVYKLLKPHFRFMMAINKHAEKSIFSPNGKLNLFSIGSAGTKRLNAKAVPLFNFTRTLGAVESDATARGVWEHRILPNYPFRDDASTIYTITKNYVTTILTNCYGIDTPHSVRNDKHLQNYRAELVKPRNQDGVGILGLPESGILGLPGSDTTGFSDISEVIDMVTMFIMQCSVGHAAVNFPQYDTYGWMPNYPADMKRPPLNHKVDYTEEDIMGLLPDKSDYLGVMGITKLLSWDGTNELGHYEKTFFHDRVSVAALNTYKTDLKKFSKVVKRRNSGRRFPYKYLDPEYVPNAISI